MATKKSKTDTATATAITLPAMQIERMQLTLVGDSPLICHAWSEKAKRAMLDRQMKKAKQARETRDPEADYWSSLYVIKDHPERDVTKMRFGFPAVAFKSAAVDACSHVQGITKVEARGAFHIDGDMVQINGVPTPREDMVRVMNSADIRFRGEFREWSARLTILYNASVLSAEQIAHLFTLGGFAIGAGEWRPQKDGSFGRFHVG
ncbi:MAG: hypothetical protein JWM41_2917 [Gemmatimonadetes bacterium]|nr:hypothetical protein [Gemmatimonadota bacterium]